MKKLFTIILCLSLLSNILQVHAEMEEENYDTISISEGKDVLITNNRGDTITCKKGNYDATMNIIDMEIFEDGADTEASFSVDKYDSITMTDFDKDEEISLSLLYNDVFQSVEVKGANSVYAEKGKIKVSGKNYDLKIGTSEGIQNMSLINYSCKAEGKVVLKVKDNKVIVKSKENMKNGYVICLDGNNSIDKGFNNLVKKVAIKDYKDSVKIKASR